MGSTAAQCLSLAHTHSAPLPFIYAHYGPVVRCSPDHRDGLRGGERERGLLGRWSHRAPTHQERERGDACTTVRAVNFMTLPSTGDKRGKRKKNGGAQSPPRPRPRPPLLARPSIGSPSASVLPFGDTTASKTTVAIKS